MGVVVARVAAAMPRRARRDVTRAPFTGLGFDGKCQNSAARVATVSPWTSPHGPAALGASTSVSSKQASELFMKSQRFFSAAPSFTNW